MIPPPSKGKIRMKGTTYYAYIVSVYDGDTFWIRMPFEGCMYDWKCRLKGVDTPEMRPARVLTIVDRMAEKKRAKEARDKVRELILNKYVLVKCDRMGKYGRVLVDIFLPNGESLSELLIKEGLGVAYYGGAR